MSSPAELEFRSNPSLPRGSASRSWTSIHSPRQNRILAALPREDYERLAPLLVPVDWPRGSILHHAGQSEKSLYFITTGIVSRIFVTRDGACAEFAITGREGVIGVASFLGGRRAPSDALVLRSCHAYRLAASPLRAEIARGGALARLLFRYTQALIAQTGQVATCNRHHGVEQQLCRWLLSYLDRDESNEVAVTQGLLGRLLGVRRQAVAHAAEILEDAGLVRCSRGLIAVLDRAGLEARVCECYGAVKREYDRLLPASA
jgi:CRP-like cAMP-binding protein